MKEKFLLKKLSKLDLKELDEQLKRDREKYEEEQRKKDTPQIIGKCSVCEGDVQEIKEIKWPGGRMMIGGKGYMITTGAYCLSCGLMYNHCVLLEKKREDKNER